MTSRMSSSGGLGAGRWAAIAADCSSILIFDLSQKDSVHRSIKSSVARPSQGHLKREPNGGWTSLRFALKPAPNAMTNSVNVTAVAGNTIAESDRDIRPPGQCGLLADLHRHPSPMNRRNHRRRRPGYLLGLLSDASVQHVPLTESLIFFTGGTRSQARVTLPETTRHVTEAGPKI